MRCFLLSAILAGCCQTQQVQQIEQTEHKVNLVAPNGQLYKTYTISGSKPRIYYRNNGMMYFYEDNEAIEIPVGWLLEVK